MRRLDPGRLSSVSSDDERARKILRAAWELARQQWPEIKLSFEEYEACVREKHRGKPLTPELLGSLDLPALFLACACGKRDPAALKIFEDLFLARLVEQLRHLNLSDEQRAELLQRLRVHLLMGTPPRLCTYKGDGSLPSWLYVIAVRMAYKILETGRELPDDVLEILAARPAPGPSPEQALIREKFRPEFLKALREVFDALAAEDRLLLRLSFERGMSTPALAKVFGKHQTTVWRALQRVYGEVFAQTKQLLQRRLGLSSDSFESLLLSLRSQMDMRLSQVLRGPRYRKPCARNPPRIRLRLRRKHAPWYLPKPKKKKKKN